MSGITLVVPVYNGAQFIRSTLESIEWNYGGGLEVIVVDGFSTDGTIEIVREYCLPGRDIKIIQEKSSQAQAINKGMQIARYPVLNWLNADDLLVPGGLYRVLRAFKDESLDFCYANSFTFDNDGLVQSFLYTCTLDAEMQKTCGNIFTGSLFFTKKAYKACGPLDTGLKVTFEYKFYDRLFSGMRGMHLNAFVAGFRVRPDSISQANKELGLNEFSRFRAHGAVKQRVRWNKLRKYWRLFREGSMGSVLASRLQLWRARRWKGAPQDSPQSVAHIFSLRWLG